MDFLDLLISRMTDDEKSEYRIAVRAQKKLKLELQLFELLCSDNAWGEDELMNSLYNPPNAEAYHSLRKRLRKRLSDFMANRKFSKDESDLTSTLRLIYNAMTMIDRNSPESAMDYLKKAEKQAEKAHRFLILDAIYNLQLSNIIFLKIDHDKLKEKMNRNMENHSITRKLNVAFSSVLNDIEKNKSLPAPLNIKTITARIFNDAELMRHGMNNPDFMYKMVVSIRSIAVVSKEYDFFGPYVIMVYEHLKKCDAFYDGPEGNEIHFIYMIAQSYYRRWNFDETTLWLEKMQICFPKNNADQHPLYSKYTMMRAATFAYSRRPQEAIDVLTGSLDISARHLPPAVICNMLLNLAVYYFCMAEYKKANQVLLKIHQNNKWIDEFIGVEWRMKKEMIEVIFQYELNHIDLAESRIISIRRNFDEFLKQPSYQRADKFLQYILRLINDPSIATTKEFAEEVRSGGLRAPGPTEDIQAITFFCWLMSKIQGKEYYEVLMRWVDAAKAKEKI